MLTLGLMALLHCQQRVWQQAALEHTLTAALAVVLTSLAAFFVLLPMNVTHVGVGLGTPILFIFYVLGMRLIFRQEHMRHRQREQGTVMEAMEKAGAGTRRDGLWRAALGFSAAALVLLVAARLGRLNALLKRPAPRRHLSAHRWSPSPPRCRNW